MENAKIEYELSKDYKRLHELMKKGKNVIGFIPLNLDGIQSSNNSKLVLFRYCSLHRFYDMGFTVFDSDMAKLGFDNFCIQENIRFIDIK